VYRLLSICLYTGLAPALRIDMLPALKAYVPELICERVAAG